VLPTRDVIQRAPSFKRLIQDWEPDLLVSGLPYTMSGKEGPQAARIRSAATKIANACDLPLEFVDERLSSQEAKRILREKGYAEKEMRGKVDMIAASLFLQVWLDAQRATPQDGKE
jgi:putative Holliday junction resolvase